MKSVGGGASVIFTDIETLVTKPQDQEQKQSKSYKAPSTAVNDPDTRSIIEHKVR